MYILYGWSPLHTKKAKICEIDSTKKYETQALSNNDKTKSMNSAFCVYLNRVKGTLMQI